MIAWHSQAFWNVEPLRCSCVLSCKSNLWKGMRRSLGGTASHPFPHLFPSGRRVLQSRSLKEKNMNPSERIDQQIAELTDWRGHMIAQLRKLILEADPDLTEEWKWETAVWSHQGLVCAVGAFKQAVKMNFFQGAFLEDPQKLFNSGLEAKKTRAIDFREGDAVDESALKELIRAAVAHNIG